jgi:hypothetical protein
MHNTEFDIEEWRNSVCTKIFELMKTEIERHVVVFEVYFETLVFLFEEEFSRNRALRSEKRKDENIRGKKKKTPVGWNFFEIKIFFGCHKSKNNNRARGRKKNWTDKGISKRKPSLWSILSLTAISSLSTFFLGLRMFLKN